mgnify:CR=1 FL=1
MTIDKESSEALKSIYNNDYSFKSMFLCGKREGLSMVSFFFKSRKEDQPTKFLSSARLVGCFYNY